MLMLLLVSGKKAFVGNFGSGLAVRVALSKMTLVPGKKPGGDSLGKGRRNGR